MSSNGKSGHNVSFDDMPAGHKEVYIKRRNILSVACPDEEEEENYHIAEDLENIKDKESSDKLKPQREFPPLFDDATCSFNRFCMKYYDHKELEKELEWDKAHDTDSIDLGGLDFGSDVEWRKDIEINPNDENIFEACFEHFFPRAKGHAKFIDECHSSRRSPFYSSVKNMRKYYSMI